MRIDRSLTAVCLAVVVCWLGSAATVGARSLPIGAPAPAFALRDLDGQVHALGDYRGRTLILTFLSAHCPISRAYHERLRALASDLGKDPATIMLGINSSADESIEEIRLDAARNGLTFPILRDAAGEIADSFGAVRTPDVYLIDAEGRLRYRGRIDSAHRPRRDMRHDLREALAELRAGNVITTPETVAMGCPIVRTSSAPAPAPEQGAKPSTSPAVKLLKPRDYWKMVGSSPGKVVVVNFWATWCGPCVAELPELIKISEMMKSRGVRFVGVSADEQLDLESTVVPFLAARKVPYEQFLQQTDDPQEMIDVVDKDWPGTLPATFIYNKRGKLAFHRLGIIDRETLITEIEKALK
ncbi:MAG: redoxin domain-containing protein [Acidobacteriota bacterium]